MLDRNWRWRDLPEQSGSEYGLMRHASRLPLHTRLCARTLTTSMEFELLLTCRGSAACTNKPTLLHRAWDVAVGGDDQDVR